MTSELLSEQNPNQTDSTSKSPNENFTAINQNYFLPHSILNLNAETFIPLKERQKKCNKSFNKFQHKVITLH